MQRFNVASDKILFVFFAIIGARTGVKLFSPNYHIAENTEATTRVENLQQNFKSRQQICCFLA